MTAPTLEAERAEFEAWAESAKCNTQRDKDLPEEPYVNTTVRLMWLTWQSARRAAPVAEGVALPPLPTALCRDDTEHDVDYYTAEQVRRAQRDAYELGKRANSPVIPDGSQSIDTPDFRALVEWWAGAAHSSDKYTRTVRAKAEWSKLIAYIDGRTAGTASEGWKLVPVAPNAEMLRAGAESEDKDFGLIIHNVYCAMIAAAPSPMPPQEEAK